MLAERARALTGVQVELMGRAEIEAAGMGAFAAVAQGAGNEPQLITIRHEPAGASGPLIGLVGKGLTFDSGGYSLKPPARMHEMKFDMCGARRGAGGDRARSRSSASRSGWSA